MVQQLPDDHLKLTYLAHEQGHDAEVRKLYDCLEFAVTSDEKFRGKFSTVGTKAGLVVTVVCKKDELEAFSGYCAWNDELQRQYQFEDTTRHRIYELVKDGMPVADIQKVLGEVKEIDIKSPETPELMEKLRATDDAGSTHASKVSHKGAKIDQFKAYVLGKMISLSQQGLDNDKLDETLGEVKEHLDYWVDSSNGNPQNFLEIMREKLGIPRATTGPGGGVGRGQ